MFCGFHGHQGISNEHESLDLYRNSRLPVDYDKPAGDLYEEVSRYPITDEHRLSVLASQSVAVSRAPGDSSLYEFHILQFNWGPKVSCSSIRDFGHVRAVVVRLFDRSSWSGN